MIDVSSWKADEDFPIFPIGSKPKRLLRCPASPAQPFLIPGHAYLFKVAHDWRAQQLWSEVMAYRIAAMIGFDVPRCFVAADPEKSEVGALVEFFYGYPGEPASTRLVHAIDFLQRFQIGPRSDRPHSIRTNLRLCRRLGLDAPVRWWGRLLTFDALIGNSDRHPENWGFLKQMSADRGASMWAFAPAFDNGTSLGYELRDDRLREASQPERLAAYIDKGRHHCGWDSLSDTPTPHMALCRRFSDAHPEVQDSMRELISFDAAQLAEIVEECTRFDVSILFTHDRARFVTALVEARRQQLSFILGV